MTPLFPELDGSNPSALQPFPYMPWTDVNAPLALCWMIHGAAASLIMFPNAYIGVVSNLLDAL